MLFKRDPKLVLEKLYKNRPRPSQIISWILAFSYNDTVQLRYFFFVMMSRSALNNEHQSLKVKNENKKYIDKVTANFQETVGGKNAAQHPSKFWPTSCSRCNCFIAIGWQRTYLYN